MQLFGGICSTIADGGWAPAPCIQDGGWAPAPAPCSRGGHGAGGPHRALPAPEHAAFDGLRRLCQPGQSLIKDHSTGGAVA